MAREQKSLATPDILSVSWIWTSLIWPIWFGFRLKTISGNDLANPKIVAYIKSGQKWHKMKIFLLILQGLV